MLASPLTCNISVDWLTSKTAAQGAGTASNVVPVTEQVIGLASYRVWYAAGYASANAFIISNGSGLEDWFCGERILKVRGRWVKSISNSTALNHLPDSLESLHTNWRIVKKLARYLGSGFLEYVRTNNESHHDIFLFTHETRRKNTERPDVP